MVGEITTAGGAAHGIVADLTKDDDSRRIVWDTMSRFKGLDFVWNHVGHPGPAAVEGDMNVFDLAIDLNLRTVLITTEAAIPEMRARGGGSLLFTVSTSGLQGSSYSPVYSMCKLGVVGFVKSLAVRLAPEKIRVNAVCPAQSTPRCCVSSSRGRIRNRRRAWTPKTSCGDAPPVRCRSVAPAGPRRSPTPRCFFCPTRRRSSRERRCRSTAG